MRDMKKKINNKGFTLIELLAIIAITAIILGVGTYGIVNLVNKSKEKGSLISETSIKESASLYADEAGDSLWIDPGSGSCAESGLCRYDRGRFLRQRCNAVRILCTESI